MTRFPKNPFNDPYFLDAFREMFGPGGLAEPIPGRRVPARRNIQLQTDEPPQDKQIKIAVCMPTRGTVFTETISAVLANLYQGGFAHQLIIGVDPIPKSFNDLFREAIKATPDYIWVVEDDIVPPVGALDKMVQEMEENDIVTLDYPLDNGKSHIRSYEKRILYAGTGCMLVRTNSLLRMKTPYFSVAWDFIYDEKTRSFKKIRASKNKWGGQDTYFYIQAREAGLRVYSLPIVCRHLRLEKLGEHLSNKGLHKIKALEFKDA